MKEDPRRKTDSNFHFSQALLVLMRFYQEGMLCSTYNRTIITPKEAEIVGNSDRLAEGSTRHIKIASNFVACLLPSHMMT